MDKGFTEQLILDRFAALEAELAATKTELASVKETQALLIQNDQITHKWMTEFYRLQEEAKVRRFPAPFSWLFGG